MTSPNQNWNVNRGTRAHHKGGEGEGGNGERSKHSSPSLPSNSWPHSWQYASSTESAFSTREDLPGYLGGLAASIGKKNNGSHTNGGQPIYKLVRCRKRHKGDLKVLCTREKRTHRACAPCGAPCLPLPPCHSKHIALEVTETQILPSTSPLISTCTSTSFPLTKATSSSTSTGMCT